MSHNTATLSRRLERLRIKRARLDAQMAKLARALALRAAAGHTGHRARGDWGK